MIRRVLLVAAAPVAGGRRGGPRRWTGSRGGSPRRRAACRRRPAWDRPSTGWAARWSASVPGTASAWWAAGVRRRMPRPRIARDAWVPDPREAILLLHGYSGSIAPDLVEMGPFLRRTASVLGLDFRGHGASDDGPTTFGLLEVEDVAGALAFLGERGVRRVALVGSSMGGITALAAVAVLGDGRLASADADPAAPAAPRGRAPAADRGRGGRLGDAGARHRRGHPPRAAVRAADRRARVRAVSPGSWAATRGRPSRSP